MTTTIDHREPVASALPAQYFNFKLALACAATAFLGFAPTYWVPLAQGSFSAPPIIHVHGVLFFGWTMYFVFQTWLAASGRTARHRAIGMIGVSLATAMLIIGILAEIGAMTLAAGIGKTEEGLAFSIVSFSGISFFAVAVALALGANRRPEVHKRLMMLATISLLDAAVARWFPAGPPGPPPASAAIAPALTAYLLLVVAIVHDWRTRGRPHPVYIYGGLALVAVKFLNGPISLTPVWHGVAAAILTLAR